MLLFDPERFKTGLKTIDRKSFVKLQHSTKIFVFVLIIKTYSSGSGLRLLDPTVCKNGCFSVKLYICLCVCICISLMYIFCKSSTIAFLYIFFLMF